jgi:glycosyltransferase involved in cell wall biosynthesis
MIASIIITSYNYGKFLGRCIRSCLNQSINEPYEVIVVDDNSKDESIKVASEFKHFKNFKILRNKKNVGVAETSNKGFKIAKGKFIVRIDADDYVSKNFLLFLTYYMKENSKKLGVACDYALIDKNEKIIKKISSKKTPIACGILYDKKKLSKYGYYNKKFRHREEEELRARIGSHYNIGHLELALYRYRMHLSNKTKSTDYLFSYKKKIEAIQQKEIFKKTKKIKGKGKIIAIIPARLGSKRFRNKNIFKFKKLPMIAWTIKAAKKSKFINEVFVTSESKKILNISKKFNSKTILRPKELSEDNVPKIIAIRHAVNFLSKKYKKIYLVISLQANSPNITAKDIDICISDIINKNKNEVVSVDKNLNQNAAIRVMKYKVVFNKILSTHFSCSINNVADIHTPRDLERIEF